MNSFSMTINVWTPEDRATRDNMIDYCMLRNITIQDEQLDERKHRFTFVRSFATSTQEWNLLLAAIRFYHEMVKHQKENA